MKEVTLLVIAIFTLPSCKSSSDVSGSGFEALTPSAGTRAYIVANDRPFAEQVIAHNRTCQTQPGCRK